MPDEKNVFRLNSKWDFGTEEIDLELAINPIKGIIDTEALTTNSNFIYKTKVSSKTRHLVTYNQLPLKSQKRTDLYRNKTYIPNKAVMNQMVDDEGLKLGKEQWDMIFRTIDNLRDVQRLDLSPGILRGPSRQIKAERLGEQGEDFAAVIANIIKFPDKKEAIGKWLNLLTPSDIEEIKPLKTKIGDIYFGVREGKKIVYAPSLSDGTLRFAALCSRAFSTFSAQNTDD